MSHRRVHSSGHVPFFSWERQQPAGVACKSEELNNKEVHYRKKAVAVKDTDAGIKLPLPPPPCPSESPRLIMTREGILDIPLPPCPFQATPKAYAAAGLGHKKDHDPFLAAYVECTRGPSDEEEEKKKKKERKKGSRSGIRRSGLAFSCKSGVLSGVNEDALVKKPFRLPTR